MRDLRIVDLLNLDVLKFMGFELGSTITIKQEKNESAYIINGEFTSDKMQNVLDRFINKYVCCAKCKLPEMILKIEEGKIKGVCKSCGIHSLLDNKHKLAGYITKGIEKPRKKEKGDSKQTDKEAIAEKIKGKKRVKKVRIFSDPEIKAFRTQLAEKNYPLNSNDSTIQALLTKYQEVFEKNSSIEGAKKKEIIEKAYRNLKVLQIPKQKQSLYGYLYFNTVFSLNFGKQIDKEAKILKYFYTVRSNDIA